MDPLQNNTDQFCLPEHVAATELVKKKCACGIFSSDIIGADGALRGRLEINNRMAPITHLWAAAGSVVLRLLFSNRRTAHFLFANNRSPNLGSLYYLAKGRQARDGSSREREITTSLAKTVLNHCCR